MIQPKKHNSKRIVAAAAGIIALFSNLLLPGIAFSQSEQVIGLDIECGPWGITLGADTFEMAIFSENTTYITALGYLIGGKTYVDGTNPMPGEASIKIEDYRTQQPGCAVEGSDGWIIQVAHPVTYLWNDGYGLTFSPIDFKIITASNFDATETGANIASTHSLQYKESIPRVTEMWYPNGYTGEYEIQLDFNSRSTYNLTNLLCYVRPECASYNPAFGEANDIRANPVTIINNSSGAGGGGTSRYKEGSFYTGMAYYLLLYSTSVRASDYPYTATIEFTMQITD